MTPEEQQQVAAMRVAYEQTIASLARQDADRFALAESYAQQLKAAQEKIAALTPKAEVVPIKGDAA